MFKKQELNMVSAIIVAAGKGARMKGKMRKQYLDLSGRPVLAYSIMAFDSCSLIEEIFIVVPKEDIEYCQNKILSFLNCKKHIKLVHGGAKRQDSVYSGLQAINKRNTETVVIHDGVRPFIQPNDLMKCIQGSKDFGACILGIPASDTLKRVTKAGIIKGTLIRERIWHAQTPQAFQYDLILKAHENIWLAQTPQAFQYDLIFKAHENARRYGYVGTDDASLVERLGENVKIINGSRFNIKITKKEDLDIARAMFDKRLI